ncbi:MAG: serine/threonine protein kinase [Candidatus Schekmanbacteria bacterium]|nr:serine/threonine protein kinase [Candidatus Schekmanbacteria bacterium]
MKVGDRVADRYTIVGVLGKGAFGTVFAATADATGERAAIKVLREGLGADGDTQASRRFRREAQVLARVRHRGLVRLLGAGEWRGQSFLAMELVTGDPLDRVIAARAPLPPAEAASIVCQALEALGFVHAAGILHRDLKPANLMLADGGTVRLLDFGMAKLLGASLLTCSGQALGTVTYMAPESLKGEGGIPADIYSLGVILYELLAARPPFTGRTLSELVFASLMRSGKALPDVGRPLAPALWETVRRACASAPEDRFPDCEAFLAALRPHAPALPSSGGDVPDACV